MPSSPTHTAWHRALQHPSLTATQRHWLRDQGSLTTRIRAHSQHFSVQVLRQQWVKPGVDEQTALGLSSRHWVWGREVLLVADGIPRIFAHSLLARPHARGAWRMFSRMGSRSLGSALFADPCIMRQPLAFRRLDNRHPLYHAALYSAGLDTRQTPCLWARRSLFIRQTQPLMVCEVFLPEIFHL